MGHRCSVAVRLAMALAAAEALGGARLCGEPFQYDFRQGVADQPVLVPTGSGASQTLRADGQGLRITRDANRSQLDPVGVRTRFGVCGDFDITATQRLLRQNQAGGR